ncbi:hypothetical protein Tco_0607800 [Tanacetum coccineum]
MVAYLKKSEGGEGFHQIVDFLNSSYIKYALTENPPINKSFIKQFWQTASASTLEDGEVGITTTIDGQLKTLPFKYRGSNSSDGGNIGDGVKIASGVIGSGDEIDLPRRVEKNCLRDEG